MSLYPLKGSTYYKIDNRLLLLPLIAFTKYSPPPPPRSLQLSNFAWAALFSPSNTLNVVGLISE